MPTDLPTVVRVREGHVVHQYRSTRTLARGPFDLGCDHNTIVLVVSKQSYFEGSPPARHVSQWSAELVCNGNTVASETIPSEAIGPDDSPKAAEWQGLLWAYRWIRSMFNAAELVPGALGHEPAPAQELEPELKEGLQRKVEHLELQVSEQAASIEALLRRLTSLEARARDADG